MITLKNKAFRDEVYGSRIKIFAGMSIEKFTELFNKEESQKLSPSQFRNTHLCVYHFFDVEFSESIRDLIVLYSCERKIPLSWLAHELIHIKNIVFWSRNVKSGYDNDEHESCFYEFLFRKIVEEK